MSTSKYEIEYDEDGAAQVNYPVRASGHMPPHPPEAYGGHGGYPYPPPYPYYRERFRLPAIVNTMLTGVAVLALIFGAENYAPHEFKPSTMVGGYEAGIETQLKAAELNEQARFAEYEARVRLAVETQTKQNDAMLQSVLQNYQQVYDRGKIMAEAANRFQGQYLDARMAQQNAIQSADMGIISMSTLIGRGLNLLQPGAGDEALEYAQDLSAGVTAGLEQAAREGARVDLTDWDFGLVPPEQVQAAMASVRPVVIPPPPHLARHTSAPASGSQSGQ